MYKNFQQEDREEFLQTERKGSAIKNKARAGLIGPTLALFFREHVIS